MANLLLIKHLLKERNISIRDFSKDIGMTEQGLQKLIRENSTKVDTLELIAAKLKVSISVFFDKNNSSLQTDMPIVNERLISIIESQQRTIESMQEQTKKMLAQTGNVATCASASGFELEK